MKQNEKEKLKKILGRFLKKIKKKKFLEIVLNCFEKQNSVWELKYKK